MTVQRLGLFSPSKSQYHPDHAWAKGGIKGSKLRLQNSSVFIHWRKRRAGKSWNLGLRWGQWSRQVFLVGGNIFWKGEPLCVSAEYFLLLVLFCFPTYGLLDCSRLFVIYNEVQSPGSACFVPWSVSLRNSHSMPSITSPTFNQRPIGIWYTHDLGNSLPCWGQMSIKILDL